MNILFLDQFNELGGAQLCLLDLIDGLSPQGLYVGLPGVGPLTYALRSRDVTVHELPPLPYSNGRKSLLDFARMPWDALRIASMIRGIIQSHKIDLVYVNGPRLLPSAALASKHLVFHSHSLLDKRYAAILARWCLRKGRATIIASSRFVAKALPQGARIVYNGVPELPFRAPAAPVSRPWRIGIVGRIAPEKGQTDFLAAARILTERGFPAEYHVYGAARDSESKYSDHVHEIAADLPVSFHGWSTDISQVFCSLDLLAVPSSWIDATPRVIMEAFSAGVPVIAYRSGGIPELIEDGVTGVLTGSPTPESLAGAFEESLTNPERLSSMVLAARHAWKERFTVQRYVQEVLDSAGIEQDGTPAPQPLQAALR